MGISDYIKIPNYNTYFIAVQIKKKNCARDTRMCQTFEVKEVEMCCHLTKFGKNSVKRLVSSQQFEDHLKSPLSL